MTSRQAEIHILAHEIQWFHTRALCRAEGKFARCRGRNAAKLRQEVISRHFDPHAATELAFLIEKRLFE